MTVKINHSRRGLHHENHDVWVRSRKAGLPPGSPPKASDFFQLRDVGVFRSLNAIVGNSIGDHGSDAHDGL
jgi:hypothetical protein